MGDSVVNELNSEQLREAAEQLRESHKEVSIGNQMRPRTIKD